MPARQVVSRDWEPLEGEGAEGRVGRRCPSGSATGPYLRLLSLRAARRAGCTSNGDRSTNQSRKRWAGLGRRIRAEGTTPFGATTRLEVPMTCNGRGRRLPASPS